MHVDRIVGACLRTSFATDAASIIEIDDAVLSREQRFDRADLDARRVGAVIASHDGEQSSRIGERSLLDVLHPRAIHADRHFVLGLTCNRARMASDTLPVVDDEAEVHKSRLERF
jgi:hypothetical protein